MGRVQSFMLILGRVGSLHLWVGLGRVMKIGPMFNSDGDYPHPLMSTAVLDFNPLLIIKVTVQFCTKHAKSAERISHHNS